MLCTENYRAHTHARTHFHTHFEANALVTYIAPLVASHILTFLSLTQKHALSLSIYHTIFPSLFLSHSLPLPLYLSRACFTLLYVCKVSFSVFCLRWSVLPSLLISLLLLSSLFVNSGIYWLSKMLCLSLSLSFSPFLSFSLENKLLILKRSLHALFSLTQSFSSSKAVLLSSIYSLSPPLFLSFFLPSPWLVPFNAFFKPWQHLSLPLIRPIAVAVTPSHKK